ncbi:MAG: DNA-processing protein DprA [Bifidobacteriaceae bacterium]|jgi:DNA processing protein|nr:DNA-processing protein DprA [Bifidobacteriaceae bacterium]
MHPLFDCDDPILARAAWSRIAEPADQEAGALVQSLGPSAALRWLFGDRPEPMDERLSRARERWRPRLDGLDPKRELKALARLGGCLLTPEQPGWPSGLDDLGYRAPFSLWVRADRDTALGLGDRLRPAVAIVGTRASTAYGEMVTASIVSDLAERGVAIVSGGAFGIDAAAHRAALAVDGFTVAVMAGGVDRLYPLGNETLLKAVAAAGAVISELPPGAAPRRERFLSRNRLIAAMGAATVVTEAGWRSGSQRTANDAAELLRAVAAVPGPVTAAQSAGCHRLIRQGVATLVTGADEVRELMAPLGLVTLVEPTVGAGPIDGLAPNERLVFDSLPLRRSASLSALVSASGLPTPQVMASLARLERSGRAEQSGGTWRKAKMPANPAEPVR